MKELLNVIVTSKIVPVVAVALLKPDGQVLMQQRPRAKEHGGLWEFPGGKIEPGETAETALVREIAEELGLQLDPAHLEPLTFASSGGIKGQAGGQTGRQTTEPTGGAPGIVLLLYTCRTWQGEPQNLDAEAIGWFAPEKLASLPMPPLDVPLAKNLAEAINGLAKVKSSTY